MLTTEWFHHALIHTDTARDILEATPEKYHAEIVETATTETVRYALDTHPFPPQYTDHGVAVPAEFLFSGTANETALIVYREPDKALPFDLFFFELWQDILPTPLPRSSFAEGPPAGDTYARISVVLKNGKWLNATVSLRRFGPPATPLLVQLGTMAIFSALGAMVVINRATKPMRHLAQAARALGRGEFTKLEECGPREVRDTVHAFNEMQEKVSRFDHDRRRMLAALGHDLRTPITILRLHAEFIDEEETRGKISATLDDMQQMAEATLSFARDDASHEEARLVDLGEFLFTVCADLADTGRNVICPDAGEFFLRCRPVGVKRALRNVLENAVAYGKCARVSVFHRQAEVAILVDDDGPGIAEEDFENVFKPFVRLENSRSRNTGGVGLGLAITRSIIRSHGGDVTLENRAGGGLRVTLTLPST